MNPIRNVAAVEIDLFEKRRKELRRLKFEEILPEVFALVDHAPVSKVEQVCGDQRRFGVISEDIDVLALSCRDLLFFLHLLDRRDQITQSSRFLKAGFC